MSYLVFFLMVSEQWSLWACESFAPMPIHRDQNVGCLNRTVDCVLVNLVKCVVFVCIECALILSDFSMPLRES